MAAVYQLMEFTGLQLRYENCVHCGKKIEGDAAFSMHEGGVLCRGCATPDAKAFPEELRHFIVGLRDFDWQRGELRLSSAQLIAAEQLLLAYLQDLLGRPLKSLAFIQQLSMTGS